MTGTVAAAVAGSVLAVVLPGAPPPPPTIAGRWVALSVAANPSQITCRDAQHCWAAAGSAILTLGPDGHRSSYQVPRTMGTVSAVSCGTDTECVAVGGATAGGPLVLESADGGASWRADPRLPAGTTALVSVSCAPGTVVCFATSKATVLRSSGLDAAFSAGVFPTGVGGPGVISCGSARTCVTFAGSAPVRTTDGGATWTAGPGLALLYGVGAVDCVNASVCWTVGEYTNSLQSQIGAAFETVDGGATWRASSLPRDPQPYALDSISCWSPSSCVADGTMEEGGLESSSGAPYFLATADGGARWAVHYAPPTLPFAPALACPDAGVCWLAGQSGLGTSSDDGAIYVPGLPIHPS